MTVETETILIKLLEELKAEVKETNHKLDRFIETTNGKFDTTQKDLTDLKVSFQKDLTDIKVTLAEVKVEVSNTKKDVEEVKGDIKGRISIQTYWFLLLISLLIGIVGKFAFYLNPLSSQ